MAYCFDAGIPHTEFLSWEIEDRAKTIAYALERAERCASCGTSAWEWQADGSAYVAVRQQCPGCLRRESVMEDTDPKDTPKGSSVVLITKAQAQEYAANPEAHQVETVATRRARRRQAEADRIEREGSG